MYTISTLLDRKIRGHLPVTRYCAADDGSVTVAVPDEHQSRLYHLAHVTADGEWSMGESFSVETLAGFELSQDTRTAVGLTDDDVYVFREGAKTRFFPDRRDNYIDASISANGGLFALASADMIMSGYAVTLARTAGGAIWTKDLPYTATCVCISPDGSWILVGTEDGVLILLDGSRRVIWEVEGQDPIVAVAMPNSSDQYLVGTKGGAVQGFSTQGERIWEVVGDGPVSALAANGNGSVVVAARYRPDDSACIECCDASGNPLVDHQGTGRITSIACSPDGSKLGLSRQDGTFELLEITQTASAKADVGQLRRLVDEGNAAMVAQDLPLAIERFAEALSQSPSNVDACRRLIEAKTALVSSCLEQAQDLAGAGEIAKCAEKLHAAQDACPFDRDLFEKVMGARELMIADALADATGLADSGDTEAALSRLQEVVLLDVANIGARQRIGELEQSLADEYLRKADAAGGNSALAVEMLEKAAALRPSALLQERLRKAMSRQAFDAGMALYQAKKYSQALTQFRRAQSLDPDNSEAAKYVEYAESFRQDDALFDRFNRLE